MTDFGTSGVLSSGRVRKGEAYVLRETFLLIHAREAEFLERLMGLPNDLGPRFVLAALDRCGNYWQALQAIPEIRLRRDDNDEMRNYEIHGALLRLTSSMLEVPLFNFHAILADIDALGEDWIVEQCLGEITAGGRAFLTGRRSYSVRPSGDRGAAQSVYAECREAYLADPSGWMAEPGSR